MKNKDNENNMSFNDILTMYNKKNQNLIRKSSYYDIDRKEEKNKEKKPI